MRFGSPLAVAGIVAAAIAAVVLPANADAELDSLAGASVRSAIASDAFYFVMTDRYADGDPSNNAGGAAGSRLQTGFDPASDAFFHGGDLAGLTGSCDVNDPNDHGLARIKRLGFSAVWITPPFVQRTVQGDSAAYHGYWFLDLSKPDPHLGTEAQFAAFMTCAKSLGLKVFLDVVVNHTADVISFAQGNQWVSLGKRPYKTAAGKQFNPWDYTTGTKFPKLSTTVSFAKTPVVDAALRTAKVPAVLNEPIRYHNRGDIDWNSCVGRCMTDGDFSGLDDLMTEDWTVVKALADAYGAWITKYGIDGFRIDTAKHVDPYFFGRWLPLINATAAVAGKPGFTAYGEATIADASMLSELMLTQKLPSMLDFPGQEMLRRFASNQASGGSVAMFYDEDDYYTSATTNAYNLTTFLGNHDMGRIGFFLRQAGVSGDDLLSRALFAHELLYLTRGVPVVYYGDEVGMTGSGDGKDRRARQDMFPTQVQEWQSEVRIGTDPIGNRSAFDESTAIEARLGELSALRQAHPALASGAQITRYGQGSVFASSRIDAAKRTEYVVVFNAGNEPASATFTTSTPSSTWATLWGSASATTDAAGQLTVTLPARSTLVLEANSPLPLPSAPSASVRVRKDYVTGRYAVTATVPGADPSTVTVVMRRAGTKTWMPVGTDDARPFRVFIPARKGAAANVEIVAVVKDTAGNVASSTPIKATIKPF